MSIETYLYLTKKIWVRPWVLGGRIPISLASSYRNDKRVGTLTPDENLINDMGFEIKELSPVIKLRKDGGLKNFTFTNIFLNGQKLPEVSGGNHFHEDGLILSFCKKRSMRIALRMGKKACVKILNVKRLKIRIDRQLRTKGIMKTCKYTAGPNRNHFLKSKADSWQEEFRIFWPGTCPKSVILPAGIGMRVRL